MFVPLIVLLLCLTLLSFPVWWHLPVLAGMELQGADATIDKFQSQRSLMVERQLRSRGIRDEAVLNAMAKVPRHRFVLPDWIYLAYEDYPLDIGHGQTISQPYIVAFMTAAAAISPNDRVLEIGTGSGYQAAILGELAKEVYTVEIIPELAERARQTLAALGYENVRVKTGNGYEGWLEYAPYDAIVVTAAPEQIPPAAIEQLALSGKLVIPVGKWDQNISIVVKTPDGLIRETSIPVRFVPMVEN